MPTKRRPHNYRGWFTDSRDNCYIHMPEHPNATKNGYVLSHRLIAEDVLGRYLTKEECVHHSNGNRWDDRRKNLVICPDNSYHRLLHKREKALKECGHSDWLICRYCHQYDNPQSMVVRNRSDGGIRAWHKECCRIKSYQRYHKEKANGKSI